ncbi:hypothetical protein [Nocardioides sp. W7]|uniref:hypothetical protein n=1 Tax=Nocardioides sp. W7 TaxID=2931390 RepID=UPI001FD149B7|nr:hypothetical protein [Nocardioides sp. W7]
MTTSAREDRHPGPRSAVPDAGPVMTPPPKLRRRPALLAAGVAVTAVGCLLGAWAWSATTDTEEVLAARSTIHRGEVIEAEDPSVSGSAVTRRCPLCLRRRTTTSSAGALRSTSPPAGC